ncbi:hypothetical protein INT47_012575 [Mucor saturninus]|uniref:Uncharacterized protein n=1 Tax=Mucor saturninus TaxID=64648 RepID=A0A8H7UXR5_9FUNG|nr:hypothetical protein INT47_012575 [Mucor saturninus]
MLEDPDLVHDKHTVDILKPSPPVRIRPESSTPPPDNHMSRQKKQENLFDSNNGNTDHQEGTPEQVKEQKASLKRRRDTNLKPQWIGVLNKLCTNYLFFGGKEGTLPSIEVRSPSAFNCECVQKLIEITDVRGSFIAANLDVSKCFRDHLIDVRKSPGNEDDEAHQRLLQLMIKRLQSKFTCRRIHPSSSCWSDTAIMQMDKILSKLHICNGDMQDLLDYLHICGLYVRVVIIDYAGLSTNSNDVHFFMKHHNCIKEFIVENDHILETLSRFDIIHLSHVLEKFKSLIASVRRS